MRTIRSFLLALSAVLALWVPQGHAEDIDIYSGNASLGTPNILFVLDTSANFEATATGAGGVPCAAYGTGGAPSLGDSVGGIEQCALVDALSALPVDAVNIGIMMNNANNLTNTPAVDGQAGYVEPCVGSNGGCLVRKLKLMNAANKAALIDFIKGWKTVGGNNATTFNVKATTRTTGAVMQEAWAYYTGNGKVGISGMVYTDSGPLVSGCQKNFIIYIGNAYSSASTPGQNTTENADNVTTGLKSPQVAATAAQIAKITDTVKFPTTTCGVASIVADTNSNDWSENYADEWARHMKEKDASDKQQVQNITTYTIGVINDSSCTAQYPALLSTMAKYGGGKYFKTGNADEVKNALGQILNEIQAVNSVFASASLPISANAQGALDNQIFMGMFRPDATANPRWLGNLKQFQLVEDPANLGSFVLGDAVGKPAISDTGTGFISVGAVSFWTSKNVSVQPDSSGGFFKGSPLGVPASGFDLPDGEVVEKGGAAQQIRIANLTANFAANPAGGASNPRRLYTYCPSGSGCNSALNHSSNAFAIENTGLTAGEFGAGSTLTITSIVRTGTTALVTTNGNHGFTAGVTSVSISNVAQNEYNVTQVISAPSSANTFTITGLPDLPTSPTVGTYAITSAGAGAQTIVAINRLSNTADLNLQVATVETAGVHGFAVNDVVTIAGAGDFNGNRTITSVNVGGTTFFTFNVPIYPKTGPDNTYQAMFPATSQQVAFTKVGGDFVGAKVGHGFHIGQQITISGAAAACTASYNGTRQIVATGFGADSFRVNGSGNPAGANCDVVAAQVAKPIVPSRTMTTVASAFASATTTAPNYWFGNNGAPGTDATGATKSVLITQTGGGGGSEAAYAPGSTTITCTNAACTTFKYPITVTPPLSVSGGTATPIGAVNVAVAAGQITRSGATVTVTGLPNAALTDGATYNISTTGSAFSAEAAYTGSKTITCAVAPACTTVTFGPVALTPSTPATGSYMQAYSGSSPPAKDPLIQWTRGEDNFGDEIGPGGSVTVRPSVHGDVLHSRPVVINYGDSRGVVVYYGSNDGWFRAVNGNQTAAVGSVPAGGEYWGLIFNDHLGSLNRQRLNSPELKLRDTLLGTAKPKDYFVDGATGAYQKLKADGKTIDKAYIYLSMRRGGRFIYAIDVTEPTDPKIIWKAGSGDEATDAVFGEMGQSWSRPRIAVVNGYSNPVLIFGAGYDSVEDLEPPGAGVMGRGIFVLDAFTGVRVWSASYGVSAACSGDATQAACTLPEMKYAIPSDVTLLDRNGDLRTDRAYVGDMGGNVWRVDFVTSLGNTPDQWRVTKLAALGCSTAAAVCAAGVTPRKMFFPPTVISVGATGGGASFDALFIGTGDREHPLISGAAGSSHMVKNRFYMIKDNLTTTTPTAAQLAAIVPRTEVGTDVSSRLFPAFKTSSISGMVRASDVITVTTSAAHGFKNKQNVVIDGVTPATLDGQYTIIDGESNATSFTIDSVGTSGVIATAGTATVTVPFAKTKTEPGFYGYLATGEKVVNAPLAPRGTVFFGTNRPFAPVANTCASNLGEARGYGMAPFTGESTSVVYDGGGLPPSGVSGVVLAKDMAGNDVRVDLCLGCGQKPKIPGDDGGGCALGNCPGGDPVPKKPTRTYWYKR